MKFLKEHGGVGALWFGMGLGKSRTVIEYLKGEGALHETLILCPLSVAYTWQRELERWSDVKGEVVHGSLRRRLEALARPGPWILNYDGLRITRDGGRRRKVRGRTVVVHDYPLVDAVLAAGATTLVCDESTRLKDRTTRTAKVAHQIAEHFERRILLSGLPNPQSPVDFWSQIKMLERVPLGFRSPTAMREAYCVMGGYGGHEVVSFRNLDELNHRLSAVSLRRTTEECLDLPAKTYQTVEVELEGKEKAQYESMRKEAIAELTKRGTVTADNVLVKILRLQEITGGAAAPRRNGAKVQAVRDLVEGTRPPIIIWCRFVDEIEHLAKTFAKAYRVRTFYGATSKTEREHTLRAFENGAVDILIGQPRAGGIGLNLQRSCVCIYYSMSHSLEEREQSEARIYRSGQEKPVTILDIVARGTVDEKVLLALKTKNNVARWALDGVKEFFGA